jgi:hypothetical protein
MILSWNFKQSELILCIFTCAISITVTQNGLKMFASILNIKSLVTDTSSNAAGSVLFNVLEKHAESNQEVTLEIDSDLTLSSSFLNTSIGEYLDKYGVETFKKCVKFKGNRNQFNRISTYIANYEKLHADKAHSLSL